MMYKLFIADDEYEKVEGMITLIDWSNNNIEICGQASNGATALDAITQLKPDVVLLDIRMPKLSGIEILETMGNMGYDTKFIILSGYDNFSYAQKAIQLKAADYLLKPCRPDEILTAVLQAIKILELERSSKKIIRIYNAKYTEYLDDPNNNINVSLLVRKAIEFIKNNYYKDLTLQSVASEIFISSGYLSQIFKQETGVNFVDYLNKYRIEKSKCLISELHLKNYEVAEKVGFRDEKYFSQMFKKYVGFTPSEFRNL